MYEQGGKCLTLPFAPLPRQGKGGSLDGVDGIGRAGHIKALKRRKTAGPLPPLVFDYPAAPAPLFGPRVLPHPAFHTLGRPRRRPIYTFPPLYAAFWAAPVE